MLEIHGLRFELFEMEFSEESISINRTSKLMTSLNNTKIVA